MKTKLLGYLRQLLDEAKVEVLLVVPLRAFWSAGKSLEAPFEVGSLQPVGQMLVDTSPEEGLDELLIADSQEY